MTRSRGTAPRRRLDELAAAARAPAVPPARVVGGWVPEGDPLPASAGEPAPVRGARRVRPAAAAAALALAVVVALVAWSRSAGAGQVVDLPARSPVATVAAPAGPSGVLLTGPATPAPSRAAGLVVDVEGRVRRPGLVRLPAGSRVADAVRAAGGAAPGAVLARLNLARLLADGEQLLVPGPGDTPLPAASGSGAASGGPSAPLDLNAATQEGLDALPGVGPVLAARIVAWRTQHGRFTSVDELGEVPGIGPKALERLRPLVRV